MVIYGLGINGYIYISSKTGYIWAKLTKRGVKLALEVRKWLQRVNNRPPICGKNSGTYSLGSNLNASCAKKTKAVK